MMLDLVGGDIGSVHGGARTREWGDWHVSGLAHIAQGVVWSCVGSGGSGFRVEHGGWN